MFSKKFQRKYALTDQGIRNTKKGALWTVIVNLVVMGGISVLYLMMSGFMESLTDSGPLPSVVPVSYTHLDVYKRQYIYRIIRYVQTPRKGFSFPLRKSIAPALLFYFFKVASIQITAPYISAFHVI